MKIFIITAFPDLVEACLKFSMFQKAVTKGGVEYQIWNLRSFTRDKHQQIDDKPYGGGAGMVLKPEPFFRAYDRIRKITGKKRLRVVYPSPQGKLFNHQMALDLAQESELVFFCGHYKGVDERVIESLVTDEISIGDYILTGGELPTVIIIDALIRHVPEVLHSYESAMTDSLVDDLLEGPIYTHPRSYRRKKVPEILLSGNHALIEQWRNEQRLKRTRERRMDLYIKREQNTNGGNHG